MKLVILDRDGTINYDSEAHIRSPEEWRAVPGSLEAIARLTQADYHIVVATNQSGIARGFFDTRTLFAIHDTLLRAAAQLGGRIDAFFFCPQAAAGNAARGVAALQCRARRRLHGWRRAARPRSCRRRRCEAGARANREG